MSAADRLAAIQARADAATEGPWEYIGRNSIVTPPIDVDEADWGAEGHAGLRIHTSQDSHAYRYADAAFIAHARQDVPALVAALRAVLDVCDWADETVATHDRLAPVKAKDHRPCEAGARQAQANRIRRAIESALGES